MDRAAVRAGGPHTWRPRRGERLLSRQHGRLIVTTPDGRHLWGTADAAFATGLPGAATGQAGEPAGAGHPFRGVHPIDTAVGGRPTDAPALQQDADLVPAPGRRLARRPSPPHHPAARERRSGAPVRRPRGTAPPPSRRPARRTTVETTAWREPARAAARLGRVLFPDGEPPLPDTLQERSGRMGLAWAIGVLMGNRDLTRRRAAEAGVSVTD